MICPSPGSSNCCYTTLFFKTASQWSNWSEGRSCSKCGLHSESEWCRSHPVLLDKSKGHHHKENLSVLKQIPCTLEGPLLMMCTFANAYNREKGQLEIENKELRIDKFQEVNIISRWDVLYRLGTIIITDWGQSERRTELVWIKKRLIHCKRQVQACMV